MKDRTKHIFIFVFIFSVLSLTLQSSIVNFCKECKIFKAQSSSNPITEEEEESHGEDEDVSELEFLSADSFSFSVSIGSKLIWKNCSFSYSSCTKKISIPPPKFLI